MIYSELIQRVQSLYSKGVQSDDSRLSDRHVVSKLKSSRARLIKQQAKKRQKISQWNYQTLPCVELVKAPVHECPCLPPVGCSILKTKYPIPQPISDLNKDLIQSVTSINGEIIYSPVGWIEKKYKKGNKYTSSKPDYFIRNEYLYITHKNGPKIISVTALFEDPLEVENFPNFCPEDCVDCGCESPLDKDFPIDADLVDILIEMVVKELILLFNQNVEDTTNNNKDSLIQQSK